MDNEELIKRLDTIEKLAKNNSNDIRNNLSRIQQNSGALEILKEFKDDSRKIFIILIIVLCMWFATIGGFLYYISIVDYETITEEATTDGEGNACVGDSCNNGEINYGDSEEND